MARTTKPPRSRAVSTRAATGSNPRNLLTSLTLVFPLLILYHLGVLVTGGMLNGADFLTALVVHNFGSQGYYVFIGAVVVAFIALLASLRHRQHVNARTILPMLLESTIYALTMGGLIVLFMTRVLHIDPPRLAAGIQSQGLLTRFIMSIGAGVYEETVFRLGLLSGLALLFERVFGFRRWLAAILGFLLSAAAFSAVHHLGPYGDPVSLGVFTFRLLAGVFFGLLFWFRGFAVAVYTHAIYDVVVLVLRH
jgi:membrane protease YdiL (CAAX protease family)